MTKILILARLCACMSGFAQEHGAPAAGGGLGPSARISALNDYLAAYELGLFRNPGVGLGLCYHLLDRLMLECILSGGYIREDNATLTDRDFLAAGGGFGVYYRMHAAGALSRYIGLQQLVYVYDQQDSESMLISVIGALQFGLQYNFNRNIAVFGNFGAGVELFGDTNSSGEHDYRAYFQIMPPQLGIVLYFGGRLMKKAIPLALLLFVVCSAFLFSETTDCRQSFELGKEDAVRMHGSRRWYWIGVAAGFSALGVYSAVDSYIWEQGGRYDPVTGDEPPTGPMPFVCSVTVLSAPVVPAHLFPRRAKIFPSSDGVELECYRDGYLKRARGKNTRSLLYGELTAGGVFLLFSVLVANALY